MMGVSASEMMVVRERGRVSVWRISEAAPQIDTYEHVRNMSVEADDTTNENCELGRGKDVFAGCFPCWRADTTLLSRRSY